VEGLTWVDLVWEEAWEEVWVVITTSSSNTKTCMATTPLSHPCHHQTSQPRTHGYGW
jgi:hypothetical protein